jgi:hypothetical protein
LTCDGQLPLDEQLARFEQTLRRNRTLTEVLARASRLDLPAPVQIRNQARVHLWYPEKFGIPCPPHESTEAAIDTYEATAACLGVRAEPGGRWRVYAPYGLSDVFNLVVRPNPVLAPPGVYQAKAERWQRRWPALTILPWPATA